MNPAVVICKPWVNGRFKLNWVCLDLRALKITDYSSAVQMSESSHPSCWDEEQATKDGKIQTLVFQHVVGMVFYELKDGISSI